jgi:anti-sigma factor RsiW
MNEIQNSPICERGSDLIAFLYNEATAEEKRDFELHLKECTGCREEVASFGLVRESITAWRDEALSGFVSTPLSNKASKKSAVAALRQFLDLSPLWLKGATAFAVLAFCLLAALAIVRLQTNNRQTTSANVNQAATYTDEDVKRMVQEALAKQEDVKQPSEIPLTSTTAKPPKQKGPTSQVARSRRPLSRAEREQLAADLRLLSTSDDAGLQLLGDRINQ